MRRPRILARAQRVVPWLRQVAANNDPGLESDEEWGTLAGLFDRHLILGYVNGEEWYGVHPLVAELL